MRRTRPSVRLVAEPNIDWLQVRGYLEEIEGESWYLRKRSEVPPNTYMGNDGQNLIEFGGRLCYRSWEPGLNVNVTKVREDQGAYLDNILKSGHGSVLEHANYSFVFHHVSRVFTHELVRHRAGSAFSQESMRFVRLTDIPFWFPEWAEQDEELMERNLKVLEMLEEHQRWMAERFQLDAVKTCPRCEGKKVAESRWETPEGGTHRSWGPCPECKAEGTVPAVPFTEKKHKTSFMRRFAPDGVSTDIVWTANIRTLRHVLAARTAKSAEEEIRLVFHQVGEIMTKVCPLLFSDFDVKDGEWVPRYPKV